MKRSLVLLAISTLILVAASALAQEGNSGEAAPAPSSATASETSTPANSPSGAVERGRYLVEKVAMCGQCHSPRDDDGDLKMTQWLHGAPVPLQTPDGYRDKWAYKAPRIAGLPQYKTDDELVLLLTTGVNRDGKEPMPPMPPFRMSEEDAQAIAAYLRSLP